MKLLVDAISEEIETDFDNTIDQDDIFDQNLAVYDLPGDCATDEFHDTSDINTDTPQE